jgi:hypothetical protein
MFGESSKSPLLMIRWLPLLAAYQIAAMQLSSPSCLRGGSLKQLICSMTINRQLGQNHVVHENFQECSKRQSTTTIARELCRCFPTVFFSHALVDIQRVLQHSNLERRLTHHRLNECNSSIDTRPGPAERWVWYCIKQTTPLETSLWPPLYWAMDCCIPIFFFFSFFFFFFWAFYKMSNSGVHQHLPSKNCMGLKHLARVDWWWWRTVYEEHEEFFPLRAKDWLRPGHLLLPRLLFWGKVGESVSKASSLIGVESAADVASKSLRVNSSQSDCEKSVQH